jgi:hypothetical protein
LQCGEIPEDSNLRLANHEAVESTAMGRQQEQEVVANLRAGYDQLCQTYRAIDDFRSKLLGFLPAVTGGGLLLLSGKWNGLVEDLFLPVGIFGVVVTVGLLCYEIHGIDKCHALIKAGRALEGSLNLEAGQFKNGHINEPFAAAIIYPAAMAAWAYLAALNTPRWAGATLAVVAYAAGATAILRYDHVLRKDAQRAAGMGIAAPSNSGLPGATVQPGGAGTCRP